ncbi:Serine/threonine-protein kinase ATR [Frankliniella fusca]|uniref:Serine/threonine-protein kinase ATR n=1 Tax=Frankliniella fusca TaxID=407009 RepID=A0AAE1HKD2_9NEOP|nr:Serine/threonine-protein kinase ATR [Frankliniella fusca]
MPMRGSLGTFVKVESKVNESCDGLLLKAEGSLKGSVESFHLDLKQATELAIENGIDKLYQETDLCVKKVNESRNQFGLSDFGDSQESKLTKETEKTKLRYQPRLGSSTGSFLKFGSSEPSTSSAQYHLGFSDMEESSEPTNKPEQTKLMHSVLLHGSDSESESDVDPDKYNGKENSLLDVKKLINKNLQKDSVAILPGF